MKRETAGKPTYAAMKPNGEGSHAAVKSLTLVGAL